MIKITDNQETTTISQIISYTNGGLVTYSQDSSISLYSLTNLSRLEDYTRKLNYDPKKFASISEIEQLKMVIATTFDLNLFEKNEKLDCDPENNYILYEEDLEKNKDIHVNRKILNHEEATSLDMIPSKETLGESQDKEIDLGSIPNLDDKENKAALKLFEDIDLNIGNISSKNEEQEQILLERLRKVINNVHTIDCIDARIPQLMLPKEELVRFADDIDGHFLLKKAWKKDTNGGLELIDRSIIEGQKKVLGHMLKSMGRNLLEGKSIMNTSLPIIIFSNESILQRAASSLIYAPIFLEKAGQISDYLQKIKHTITFFFTSLHCAIEQLKPFNPILG